MGGPVGRAVLLWVRGPGDSSLSWHGALVPLRLRAAFPGLCPDAVTPGGAQEVGRHLPRVHMAQYELPWLGLSRSPGEDVPQGGCPPGMWGLEAGTES